MLATLTFAPLAIAVFYSAKFAAAIEILRWICLATALQVITWPMGFIILAKGKSRLFFCAELAWTIVFVLMAWLAIRTFGVVGSGIAFFGSYVFHVMLIYPIVGALTGFRWTGENKRTAAFFLSLIAGVFCACNLLPYRLSICVGSVAVLAAGVYTLRALRQMVSFFSALPAIAAASALATAGWPYTRSKIRTSHQWNPSTSSFPVIGMGGFSVNA